MHDTAMTAPAANIDGLLTEIDRLIDQSNRIARTYLVTVEKCFERVKLAEDAVVAAIADGLDRLDCPDDRAEFTRLVGVLQGDVLADEEPF